MSANEPFKASRIQVGRIVNAITSDSTGNLIFSDDPNPSGVTLTELLKKIDSNEIPFDNTGTFFVGATTVQQALTFLNQAAYLQSVGKTLFVDPTIPNDMVVEGQIYNNLKSAAIYADSLTFNGYNTVNIVLMGSHRDQGPAELTTDIGVHEFVYDGTWLPIILKKNGIQIIGYGNPTIRLTNFAGTLGNNVDFIQIDTDGVKNNISTLIKDVHFEFVNCNYVSAIHVVNSPINSFVKDKSGTYIENVGVSFVNGTQKNVRLVDVSNIGVRLVSSVFAKNIHLGSFTNLLSTSSDIQLFYLDHNGETSLFVQDLQLAFPQQSNGNVNVDATKVTSFVGATVLNGRLKLINPTLDEKSYWNSVYFVGVKTKLLKAFDTSIVDIHNANIVRDSYNPIEEGAGGTTLLVDWIEVDSTVVLNATGIDEIYNVQIVTPSTSSTPTTSTPTTSSPATGGNNSVKPVKSFWNKESFAFGIGVKNELRLGQVDPADVSNFQYYDLNYGVPFWYNKGNGNLQYWNGLQVVTVGAGGGGGVGSKYTLTVATGDFTPVTYSFPSEVSYTGFQVIINHNFSLFDKNDFIVSVTDVATNRKIIPQEVVALSINSFKLIMADTVSVRVSVVGF